MFFETLIADTVRIFSALDCKSIALPGQFAKAVSAGHEVELTLANFFYNVADVGELRIAHTCAPKISIIAVFFFPYASYQLPVYSMEFVLLGQKPIVALMDMLCLIQPMATSTQVKGFMVAAHKVYPAANQTDDIPPWFAECRSGDEFFYKPAHKDDFLQLATLHLQLVENVVTLVNNAEMFGQEKSEEHQLLLDAYKRHHAINSPGIRLMNQSFGAVWTEAYLSNYLFA